MLSSDRLTSSAFTPLQSSTTPSPFDKPPAEALQLYSPLQPSTALYSYTAIHPLHSTTLYNTPQGENEARPLGAVSRIREWLPLLPEFFPMARL